MGNPRTINGALKRGWHLVKIKRREDLSWIGILTTIDRLVTNKYFVSQYDMQGGGYLAFDNEVDASIVQFQFGHFG